MSYSIKSNSFIRSCSTKFVKFCRVLVKPYDSSTFVKLFTRDGSRVYLKILSLSTYFMLNIVLERYRKYLKVRLHYVCEMQVCVQNCTSSTQTMLTQEYREKYFGLIPP